MSIYTKRGDKGETGLYDAKDPRVKRVSKASLRIEAIGAVDELNSYLGIAISVADDKKLNQALLAVQKNLLTIGSVLAESNLSFPAGKTKLLEKQIDEMDKNLPTLRNFIYPGGSQISAHLQYARSLVRKVERKVTKLNEEKPVKPAVLTYLNRLSDYLFTLARHQNLKKGLPEKVWKGKRR